MIAGAGFARMALELALYRMYGYRDFIPAGLPTPRGTHSNDSASAEYYRIIDKAAYAWKVRQALSEQSSGWCPKVRL